MQSRDYIDSNIIVEILIEGKYKNNCEEYLYSLKVHKTPVGIISFLTLGEIVKVILEEIEDSPKRDFVFGKLLEILKPIESNMKYPLFFPMIKHLFF